jgi:hypothetical protein
VELRDYPAAVAGSIAGGGPQAAGEHLSNQSVAYTMDAPDWRAVVQVVGKRVDVTLENEWSERTPRTQIVAIGAAGIIDTRLMEGIFTSCSAAAANIVA